MLAYRSMILIIWFWLNITSVLAQTVFVSPKVSTTPTAGNADDPAIWIHPTDPSKSVIIGTDKEAGIYVWNLNGEELQHIPQKTKINNVDVRYGIQLGEKLVDIVAANLRDVGKLAVFIVNPNYKGHDVLIQIADKKSTQNDLQKGSYGFCLYKRSSDGTLFVFDRPADYENKNGVLRQYRIDDDGTGNGIIVSPVRDLNYRGGVAEGFVADDELGFLYIAEEDVGVHKYYADPEVQKDDPIALFATDDGISGDREGLGLYKCHDGTGYLLLVSQGNSTFKVYKRQQNNKFVKTIKPLNDKNTRELGTDGIDVTSAALPNFFYGVVIAHDESGTKYHLYDWVNIAGNELTICKENPQQFR